MRFFGTVLLSRLNGGVKRFYLHGGPPIALKFGTHTANGTKLILHLKKAGTAYQGEATRRFKATSHMSRIEVFMHFTRKVSMALFNELHRFSNSFLSCILLGDRSQIFDAQRTVAVAKTNI